MKVRRDPLDILFSKLVKLNAGGKCDYCGKQGSQTSHFHGRRYRAVRWDLDNVIWACFSCHMYLGEHPNKHYEFFRKRLGTDKFELLNIRAEKIEKIDKEALGIYLKRAIKRLEG